MTKTPFSSKSHQTFAVVWPAIGTAERSFPEIDTVLAAESAASTQSASPSRSRYLGERPSRLSSCSYLRMGYAASLTACTVSQSNHARGRRR